MNAQAIYAVPDDVLPFAGEIMDLDGHEHTPPNMMVETFGSVVERYLEAFRATKIPTALEDRSADDAALDVQTVWTSKLSNAPGVVDMGRRLQVLEMMGVRRQLLFPGALGIQALMLYQTPDQPDSFLTTIRTDRGAYARQLIDAYNEWCGRVARFSPQIRAAAILVAESPEDLLAETRKWIDKGVRCFWVPSATLPGARSPAHADLDPLYALLAAENATLCFHAGASFGFLTTEKWRDAPSLSGFRVGSEFSLDPWTLCNQSRASENYLTVLALGGVFERHPKLRCVFAEVAADWVGPVAYKMDMWVESGSCMRNGPKWVLDAKPSEYMQRNIRVSPFFFEDVGDYIARYGLEDVYCYASDYPHIEGGVDPMQRFSASLKKHGHGEPIARKFFVENAKWALPD